MRVLPLLLLAALTLGAETHAMHHERRRPPETRATGLDGMRRVFRGDDWTPYDPVPVEKRPPRRPTCVTTGSGTTFCVGD